MQYKSIKYIVLCITLAVIFSPFAGAGEFSGTVFSYSPVQDTTKKPKKQSKKEQKKKEVVPEKINVEFSKDTIRIFDPADSLKTEQIVEMSAPDSTQTDTLPKKKKGAFIDQIITSKNKDSMIMDLRADKIFMYKDGTVKYLDNTLNAEVFEMDMKTNNILAKGAIDSLTNEYKKTTFTDKGIEYKMDSMLYNIKTEKGKIYGVNFTEGEGNVHGKDLKKVGDVMNIKGATYSTCDLEHPHFYLASVKAQYINKKDSKQIIIGPSYIVLEDVPLPLILPFGFFPLMTERSSGIILPSFGEENLKGFYLRDGGWYQVINDYWDVALRGSIYTMGSWSLNLSTNYKVRYRFGGNLMFDYSNDVFGNKNDPDHQLMKNYKLTWTHTQDPKARPGSSFAASVNFATSGYNRFDGNLQDFTSTQTNSSISYSKTWMGTPFSLSTSIQQSQNNKDSNVIVSLPNLVFNVNKIYPFKRKKMVGAQRWYEKIGFTYNMSFNNQMSMKEKDLFTRNMFDNMKYGMRHTIPVSTSFNLFGALNISPSFNYEERWYFEQNLKEWDPVQNKVISHKEKGFNRVYNYSANLTMNTTIYGMYTFKQNSKVQAIRHVLTPQIGFSYSPNFGSDKYGYYRTVQTDSLGTIQRYTPFEGALYSVPGYGESASMSFSLNNNLEMKVRSTKDSTGIKKVAIFESLNLGTSYNFLADSMNLAPISFSARTTLFKSLGIDLSGNWDLYYYTPEGKRTKDFAFSKGSWGRITNLSISFGYSFRSVLGYEGKNSGTGSEALMPTVAPQLQGEGVMGQQPLTQSDIQTIQALNYAKYYNFSVPWNLTFNYNFSMTNTGATKNITQTLSLNGGVNLTPKWAVTFNSGLDLMAMKITTTSVSIVRDLHCWQMSLGWVPFGFRKSWNFSINVKSSVLQDLRLKKSSNFLDNYYNTY